MYFRWSEDGCSIVTHEVRFVNEVLTDLPGLVQIASFANFRRQLREYSFEWRNNSDISGEYVFSHPYFIRGRRDLLQQILTRRKTHGHLLTAEAIGTSEITLNQARHVKKIGGSKKRKHANKVEAVMSGSSRESMSPISTMSPLSPVSVVSPDHHSVPPHPVAVYSSTWLREPVSPPYTPVAYTAFSPATYNELCGCQPAAYPCHTHTYHWLPNHSSPTTMCAQCLTGHCLHHNPQLTLPLMPTPPDGSTVVDPVIMSTPSEGSIVVDPEIMSTPPGGSITVDQVIMSASPKGGMAVDPVIRSKAPEGSMAVDPLRMSTPEGNCLVDQIIPVIQVIEEEDGEDDVEVHVVDSLESDDSVSDIPVKRANQNLDQEVPGSLSTVKEPASPAAQHVPHLTALTAAQAITKPLVYQPQALSVSSTLLPCTMAAFSDTTHLVHPNSISTPMSVVADTHYDHMSNSNPQSARLFNYNLPSAYPIINTLLTNSAREASNQMAP